MSRAGETRIVGINFSRQKRDSLAKRFLKSLPEEIKQYVEGWLDKLEIMFENAEMF